MISGHEELPTQAEIDIRLEISTGEPVTIFVDTVPAIRLSGASLDQWLADTGLSQPFVPGIRRNAATSRHLAGQLGSVAGFG